MEREPGGLPDAAPGLGIYVHVPFCSSRCGYCDFNTYTAPELGDTVRRDTFHEVLIDEVRFARETLGNDVPPVSTVFVGGGTPTLLGADGLVGILSVIRDEFGLTPGAEVTTEANPDSVDGAMLEALLAGGFTRVSLGMQSSSSAVLRILDRTHTPGASVAMAHLARDVGFEHVNLDLIYGTPGETDNDLRRSLDDALSSGVDHVSAYALIVEDGTPMARRIRRGEMSMPDDDVAAERYEMVDDMLTGAGLEWYEVSNWARAGGECRHNLGYWRGDDWWGVGPGAHSHVAGRRWWNIKHPRPYTERVLAHESPQEGSEQLTAEQVRMEQVMLGVRLCEGLPVEGLDVPEHLRALGWVDGVALDAGRLVLTRSGRLMADAVVRDLLGDPPG